MLFNIASKKPSSNLAKMCCKNLKSEKKSADVTLNVPATLKKHSVYVTLYANFIKLIFFQRLHKIYVLFSQVSLNFWYLSKLNVRNISSAYKKNKCML